MKILKTIGSKRKNSDGEARNQQTFEFKRTKTHCARFIIVATMAGKRSAKEHRTEIGLM